MPYVRAEGVDVHYIECGPPDAAHTLVALHGFTIDHRAEHAALEPVFAGREGWRRLYLDFPGMGLTKAPDWVESADDVFRVTLAAVRELVPGRFAVMGASFGGYIAAGLAVAEQPRMDGLGIYVPVVEAEHEKRRVPARSVLIREPGVVGSQNFQDSAVVMTAEVLRRAEAEVEVAFELTDEAACDRIAQHYVGTFPRVPALGSFNAPALILTGRQDDVVGYADQWTLLDHLPRATFAVLDRAGHGLQIEQSRLFETLVGEWVDRVEEFAAGAPGMGP